MTKAATHSRSFLPWILLLIGIAAGGAVIMFVIRSVPSGWEGLAAGISVGVLCASSVYATRRIIERSQRVKEREAKPKKSTRPGEAPPEA